jgi:magnesium-transporting ATPase (P-type)
MKTCPDCQLTVESGEDRCVLCGAVLEDDHQSLFRKNFPTDIVPIRKRKKINLFANIALFSSVTIIALCVLINVLTWQGVAWSIIVAGGLAVAWALIGLPIIGESNLNNMLITQMICLQLFLILIDLIFDYSGWSINYAYPFIYILVGLAVAIFVIIYRVNWRDYLMTLFVIAVLGVIPVLFLLFGWVTVPWPSYLAILFAVLCTLALLTFSSQKFGWELKKRFRI